MGWVFDSPRLPSRPRPADERTRAEVRGEKQNFLYSKVPPFSSAPVFLPSLFAHRGVFAFTQIMCWVAMDRGLRLADKRSLPCPNRDVWLNARDKLYDEIQTKGYNHEQQFFGQSYENNHVLDAAVLIMPLVFFMPPSDPRFQNTLKAIMRPRDRGGSVLLPFFPSAP